MGNDLVVNNPLRALGLDDKADGDGATGLVMARAGLGKTAILVQFALDCMLLGNKVLHVSIGEGVDKTRTWYDDILALLTDGEKIEEIPEIMQNRMIMTFKESGFSKALFVERLEDLVKQGIYQPSCLIVDGYDFENNSKESLEDFKTVMVEQGIKMLWFSAVSHRNDDRTSAEGVPAPCHEVDDLFDTVLHINPNDDEMNLDIIKCDTGSIDPGTTLVLDPSTMLLKKS